MTQFKHQYRKESNRLKDEWRTPPEIFVPLNDIFGFSLDTAANRENSVCDNYLENGLTMSWETVDTAWCNCPYTEGQYAKWIIKARDEWVDGGNTSVLLVPASLETKGFVPVWQSAMYLILPYKRIKFMLPDGSRLGGAPFASAIPVFGRRLSTHQIDALTKRVGHVMPLYEGYRSKYRQ